MTIDTDPGHGTEPYSGLLTTMVPAAAEAIDQAGRVLYGDEGWAAHQAHQQVLADQQATEHLAELAAARRAARRREVRQQLYTAQEAAILAVIVVIGALAALGLGRFVWLLWTVV
jgi:hypothetical protein